MVGMAKVAKEVGKHLETDLKAELTDDKIDKVLEVTPALREFSKTAEHKWDLDPDEPDFTKFATAMGAMSDYIAFFESHDTRITEYYADTVRIADARATISLRKANAEALAKHETERAALQAEFDTAEGEEKDKLQQALDRNAKAKETLDKMQKDGEAAREKRRSSGAPYVLSDKEMARVAARVDEIDAVLHQRKDGDAESDPKPEP